MKIGTTEKWNDKGNWEMAKNTKTETWKSVGEASNGYRPYRMLEPTVQQMLLIYDTENTQWNKTRFAIYIKGIILA